MTWHDGLFLEAETPEQHDDPYRCTWCRRPFDSTRMLDQRAPEALLFESTLRMRAEGRSLQEVLQSVRSAWQHEEH